MLVVVLLPLLLVALSSGDEALVAHRLEANARDGANEAAIALEASEPNAREDALDAIARRRSLRLRVLDSEGRAIADVDHEAGTHPLRAFGALFFGADGAPSLRAFDETLGPIAHRSETTEAIETPARAHVHCARSEGAKLLLCSAARLAHLGGRDEPHLVYAQESSRRPVRALYDLRYELAKLVLVMLPVGLLLAVWLGWRTVRPIEQLRRQVLAKAAAVTKGDLDLPRRDEIGDLAEAFNALLRTLDARRAQNEAFVADLVHELKTPVAAIRACAESLESGYGPAKAERLARVLTDSSARLDALVTQFLELARAEAGLPNEERSPIDVGRLAAGIVGSMRAAPAYAGVTFAIDEAPCRAVVGVEHRIDSALRNLVENAASFAAPRGHVRVRASNAGDRVEIVVTDDGPGIDAADLPRVFDRFFTTRGLCRGTGLGLALVRAVVLAHGGAIDAESRLGEGATFRVLLPCEASPASSP